MTDILGAPHPDPDGTGKDTGVLGVSDLVPSVGSPNSLLRCHDRELPKRLVSDTYVTRVTALTGAHMVRRAEVRGRES